MSYQASPMETTTLQPQTPSYESFSYGWLANIKSSSSFDPQDEASFIEMDPRLPPSKRFIRVSSDLVFEFPASDSPLSLDHADELISNGLLVPVSVKDANADHFDAEDYYISNVSISSTSDHHKMVRSSGRARCALLRRCRILKYLMLLLRAIVCKRGRSELETSRRKRGFSNGASPRSSVTYSGDDNWRRSCDSESSIYEAVLHCKRTHQANSL